MIATMLRIDRKKSLLEALNRALVGYSAVEVAEAAALEPPEASVIYNFRNKKDYHPINELNQHRLEAWLKENGYYVDSTLSIGQESEGDDVYYKGDTKCPECGEMVPGRDQGFMWCGKCMELLGKECPECGWVGPPEYKFCPMCTEPLTEPARKESNKDREDLEALEGKKRKKPKARKRKGEIEF